MASFDKKNGSAGGKESAGSNQDQTSGGPTNQPQDEMRPKTKDTTASFTGQNNQTFADQNQKSNIGANFLNEGSMIGYGSTGANQKSLNALGYSSAHNSA